MKATIEGAPWYRNVQHAGRKPIFGARRGTLKVEDIMNIKQILIAAVCAATLALPAYAQQQTKQCVGGVCYPPAGSYPGIGSAGNRPPIVTGGPSGSGLDPRL